MFVNKLILELLCILYHHNGSNKKPIKNLSKEELIEELIKLSDLIISRFDDFLRRYEVLSPDLSVSKNCNCLLSERIV